MYPGPKGDSNLKTLCEAAISATLQFGCPATAWLDTVPLICHLLDMLLKMKLLVTEEVFSSKAMDKLNQSFFPKMYYTDYIDHDYD